MDAAASLQAWFTDRLVRERDPSPHKIASYRDTIRLLLTYASQKLGVEPSRLDLGQLDAPLISPRLRSPGQIARSVPGFVLRRGVSPQQH